MFNQSGGEEKIFATVARRRFFGYVERVCRGRGQRVTVFASANDDGVAFQEFADVHQVVILCPLPGKRP